MNSQIALAQQRECAKPRGHIQSRIHKLAATLNVIELAIFQKFIMALAKNDQIGLIVEDLFENRNQRRQRVIAEYSALGDLRHQLRL